MTSLVFKRMASIAILSFSLVGCGNILGLPGGGNAPQIFDLTSHFWGETDNADKKVILLDTISMSDTLKSNLIVVKPSDQEYSFIKDALWADQLPNLIEKYLVRQYSGPHYLVAPSDFDLKADYRLRLDVEEFAGIISGGQVNAVEVTITATLLQNTPLEILGRKVFSQRLEAKDIASDIVSTMNKAMATITDDISGWVTGYRIN